MAHHINRYLVAQGHEVHVILHQYKGPMYEYEGVTVFPATGNVDAYLWADVILTHLDFVPYTIGMGMTVRRPVVHVIHNDVSYGSIENAIRGNYVVYNSDWIGRKLKYPWPSVTVHPPCDVDYYNVNDDPSGNEYITLISLNERKGGWMFKQIAEAMPERKFLGVVGSYDNPGPLKLSQADIIAQMPPNVKVIPNSPDILSVYRQTRLLLMPSDYESWGRTATEAMCNGIPVICTPTDGLKENCGQAAIYVGTPIENPEPGGLHVDRGTVEEWVAAIKKLDKPATYRKHSLLCRRRAEQLRPAGELAALEQFLYNARF